ncbi:hypothetical protein MKW92_041422 [Papaver armeniacum]|nr:hypothetical protein MKW92_041422 [Papaver armeniacum]
MVQMDNERMRSGNVMSVEIALQREAEYMKRIQNLQKPSCYDSPKILMSDQGVPSKVAPEESQQKFSSQYESYYLKEVTQLQFQEPSTPIQGSSPLAGMKRKTPEKFTCSSPQPEQQSYVPQTVNIWCEVCQVPCTSVFNFKQHCQGRKHKSKVEVEELMQKNKLEVEELKHLELKHLNICKDKKDSGTIWCDICSVPCTDGSAYRQHCNGKKHAACLKAFNKAMRGK